MSEANYIELAKRILIYGEYRDDRTGVGIYSLFGERVQYDLTKGFPLLTSKKVYWKGVLHELIWFLSGDTNVRYLQERNVKIWDAWADDNGDLGPVYGKQWRDWGGVDQIAQVIESIKTNPTSRRLIVNAWNVGELDQMALPPCHMTFQFYVRKGEFLDCQLYQRSADMFLGVPFNIASYALLTHLIAALTDLKPGVLTHVMGDTHIYFNHVEQIKEQISRFERAPRPFPKIAIRKPSTIDTFCAEDVVLLGYDPHPPLKGEVAV